MNNEAHFGIPARPVFTKSHWYESHRLSTACISVYINRYLCSCIIGFSFGGHTRKPCEISPRDCFALIRRAKGAERFRRTRIRSDVRTRPSSSKSQWLFACFVLFLISAAIKCRRSASSCLLTVSIFPKQKRRCGKVSHCFCTFFRMYRLERAGLRTRLFS